MNAVAKECSTLRFHRLSHGGKSTCGSRRPVTAEQVAATHRYRKVINDLLEAHREIESRVPALGEWTRKDRKDRFLTRILLPIAVGIIVTLVGQYLFSIFVR